MLTPRRRSALGWILFLACAAFAPEALAQPIPREQLSRERVYVTDFGADKTGAADSASAFNAAVAAVNRKDASSPGRGEIVVPPGRYKLLDTVHVYTTSSSSKIQVTFVGAGTYTPTGDFGPVVIDATALTDRPAFNFQNCRRGGMRGFYILGPNTAPSALSPAALNDTEANWLTVGVSDNQHSPQCAVCVDAFNGAAPVDAYPGVTYATGKESAYLRFEDLTLINHCVGIMIGPNDADSRGDTIIIDQPVIRFCKYGISSGMRNALSIQVRDFYYEQCLSAITTRKHGKKEGVPPCHDTGAFVACYNWFDLKGNTSPVEFRNCFAEYQYRMGYIGADDGTSPQNGTTSVPQTYRAHKPVVFKACRIRHRVDGGSEANDAAIQLVTYAPVTFEQTEFEGRHGIFNVVGDGLVTYRDCLFNYPVNGWDHEQHYVGWQQSFGLPRSLLENSRSKTNVTPDWDDVTGFSRSSWYTTLPERIALQPYSERVQASDGNSYAVKGAGLTYVDLPAGSYVHTSTTLQFTATTAADFRIGDVCYWQTATMDNVTGTPKFIVPMLLIDTISGTTITCKKLYRSTDYDETYAPSNVAVAPRLWAPSGVLTADLTSGASTTANLSSNYHLRLNVGDFVKGQGIPAGTRINTLPGYASDNYERAPTGYPTLVVDNLGATNGFAGYGRGLVYTENAGTWRMKDGVLEAFGSSPGGQGWIVTLDPGCTTITYQATIKHTPNTNGNGLIVRFQDTSNHYQLRITSSSAQWFEIASGTATAKGTATTGISPTAGDVVIASVNGSNLSAQFYRSGVSTGTAASTSSASSFTSSTACGFRNSDGAGKFDEIKVTPIGTPGMPTLTKNATSNLTASPLYYARLSEQSLNYLTETTFDPPSVADASQSFTDVTVTGARTGDFARAAWETTLPSGWWLTAQVVSADTVRVTINNRSGGAADLAIGRLRVEVRKN